MSKHLSDIEFKMIWMSLLHSYGKESLVCQALPLDIVKHYYHRLTDQQCEAIISIVHQNHKVDILPAYQFDLPLWYKFFSALDRKQHKRTHTKDDNFFITFDANGRVYPLEEYVSNPYDEIYIDLDTIQTKTQPETPLHE